MHLSPEQLIDIAEGATAESSFPHLAACDACRRQLTDLRAMMAAAADVEVPEPSPLFWDRLSARVSDAVAAEPTPAGWNWWVRAAMPFALAAAAALAIAFAITSRLLAPQLDAPPTPFVAAAPPPAAPSADTLAPEVTDPSLALVADLTQDLGWDEAREAGLAPRGSAEHAVTHLTERELQQLRDLLQEAMANSGD
jgi:hypothetical protein